MGLAQIKAGACRQIVFSQLLWLDFWLLLGAQLAALGGIYASLFGTRMEPGHFELHYIIAASLYASVSSAFVVVLASTTGFPVLPLCESLWHRTFRAREAMHTLILAATIGGAFACLSIYYRMELIRWLGGPAPNTHFTPSALEVICAAVIEEIFFRAIVLPGFAGLNVWISRRSHLQEETVLIWTANLLQAFVFGAGHILAGRGILFGQPWYVRVPLSSQTWLGFVLGWLYWRFGIERAIVCHATFDLSLMVATKWIVRAR
jgi:hypothetical protein